jgi:IS30 family transposase
VVSQAIISLLEPFANQVHTITGDNGKEFANHETIAKRSNENVNGFIPQNFPKKNDFSTILDEDVEAVLHKLNHLPRKCLDFLTPFAVFLMNSVALETRIQAQK